MKAPDRIDLAVHEAIQSADGHCREPVSGPAYSQGSMVGFVNGSLALDDHGRPILDLVFIGLPSNPPSKVKGRPRRDARRVAVALAYCLQTGWFHQGKMVACQAIERMLSYGEGGVYRVLFKEQEQTGKLLANGLQIVGETTSDTGTKEPLSIWFDPSARIHSAPLALTISGPAWYWRPGMREAEFEGRYTFKATAGDQQRLAAILAHVAGWQHQAGKTTPAA
ncbi:hypothetical protein [uncultured Lamprocystis sp.]|jgi:hypothetical protein|uniref:hypothetical protein n=1 Tax=uncultured Lamprocystis sp. TaxID=543132 RepID=UPI0025F11B52|nr:hypothetical protein [uncultured Lamprocystis sp.]